MKVLAIETSCDETGVAVLEKGKNGIRVLNNQLASQAELHQEYGGVYPNLAVREHQKNLIPLLKRVLDRGPGSELKTRKLDELKRILKREPELFKQTKNLLEEYERPEINALAVTVGPGLEPCLWTGINLVKALALVWNLPVIPVNHMEAHILVTFVDKDPSTLEKNSKTTLFPAVALLVSGGHTQLVLVREIGDYRVLGETRDDAAGECFDKTARILGLPYPGGPAIAAEAAKAEPGIKREIELPRPMINSGDYDFSFSGLKTAVLYEFEKQKQETRGSEQYVQAMAAEIQEAIVEVLVKKTTKAARDFRARSVILGGGVAANKRLRKDLLSSVSRLKPETVFLTPPEGMATDNAVMIGVAALLKPERSQDWKKMKADANLKTG